MSLLSRGLNSLAALLSRPASSSGDRRAQYSLPEQDLLSSGLPSPAVRTDLLEKMVEEEEVGTDLLEEEEEEETYLCICHGGLIYILDHRRDKVKFGNDPQPLPIIDRVRCPKSWDHTVGTAELMMLKDILMTKGDLLSCIDQLSLLTSAFCLIPLYDIIPPLKNTKFYWPVVEKIGNQIHIFESVPPGMSDPSFTPSHQLLDLDKPNHEWEIVPPLTVGGLDRFICRHLVVGDKIFAKHRWFDYREFSVFDCNTRKWELRHGYQGGSQWRHLAQYSSFEYSICVERFYKTQYESPFYLVIMFDNDAGMNLDDGEVSAIALGVTEDGDVLWTQRLPQFFDGIAPMFMMFAHVFRVDEKTMCVVMDAYQYAFYLGECDVEQVLYISSFCMDEGSQCLEGGVRVVLKERHVYKVGKDFPGLPQRMRACVSTFPKGIYV